VGFVPADTVAKILSVVDPLLHRLRREGGLPAVGAALLVPIAVTAAISRLLGLVGQTLATHTWPHGFSNAGVLV
jgi:hypothetical protein